MSKGHILVSGDLIMVHNPDNMTATFFVYGVAGKIHTKINIAPYDRISLTFTELGITEPNLCKLILESAGANILEMVLPKDIVKPKISKTDIFEMMRMAENGIKLIDPHSGKALEGDELYQKIFDAVMHQKKSHLKV